MADSRNWPADPNAVLRHPFAITPADADLADWARMVECSAECTLHVTTLDGTVITKTFYKGENWIPVRRVWSTSTVLGGATLIGWY
jgi:hypothetical protein